MALEVSAPLAADGQPADLFNLAVSFHVIKVRLLLCVTFRRVWRTFFGSEPPLC